ncbi:baseplate J/gp47 family protein [Flavobacterium tyrosinilyticum]|uniref:baseplate J/gp47 family protein n=1 Tax=Flavobacterium tyrosinilyticum TaxID=1658740 RepID=UPI00202EE9F9|nr:baseplate J/gp47 family protein [Flavobacterium tyrosinilyticum]MCM0668904.1 hypothetical protein [Flavobacterium tyrosinilyticum]
MILIDQNSAINSLNEALVPNPYLIDGRTEQDWLYFLTEFSKLINFYNDSNTIEGNWSPFLLKDPVFLMAYISKTNYKKLFADYKNGCLEIQRLLENKKSIISNTRALNNLFDRITAIYQIIERWTHHMLKNSEIYDLKTYMLQEVKNRLSIDFWAIQSYRQYLLRLSIKNLILTSVSWDEFKSFDKNIWYINKDKIPFWQVFGFEKEHPILDEVRAVLKASLAILTKIGDKLFQFLETIIHHAAKEYQKLNLKKGNFPDTVLLRSFVNILKIQQDQLNGLSEKHLDFYYKNILKQTKLPAVADKAFLCATLTKPTSVYTLPAGTLFNAGVDAQKNPILFASKKNVNLNPATIASVHKLSYQDTNNASYNLQTIVKPTEIQLDPENKAISWETFGSDDDSLNPSLIGIAFASPMLLLREGTRTLTVTLEFDSQIDLKILQEASYFLSTQNDWLQLNLAPSNFTIDATKQNAIIIAIILDPSVAAIEPFLVNPDGLKSDWPMMKVLFQNVPNPQNPPKVTAITIDLKVEGVKTFQLYNDYGELSTKSPFPPFGPIPLVNANFIIGNNEILSKPLDSFTIQIDWDKRPANFEIYYKEYSDYLHPPKKRDNSVIKAYRIAFPRKQQNIAFVREFSNANFMVCFNIMQDKSWQGIKMTKIARIKDDQVFIPTDEVPQPVNLFDTLSVVPVNNVLSTSNSDYIYAKSSSTKTDDKAWKPNPNIQKEPLKYSEESTSGFIKMTLNSPQYGFGSELYANVVASIALQNGYKVAHKQDDFIPAANIPFVPKIQTFSAQYDASVTYNLDGTAGDYPLQYFIYAPFSNYTVFDSETADKTETNVFNTEIIGSSENDAAKGFPLYPSFDHNGALFIELDNLICNSTLNFYFELARNSTALTDQNEIMYYYLSDSGWTNIKPLSDQTNQFRCSGIVEIPIPADCNNNSSIMPGNKNWISIAAVGNLKSFSKTTFMQTNGFIVQRTGTMFLTDTQSPQIAANAITKTEIKIPEIGTIIQPFASFGGKAAEDKIDRNKRVSNSIKTKNRASTASDYYTLIAEKFDTVYYSKVVTDESNNITNVYLVKKIASDSDSNAFTPLVTNALEIEVQKFLSANSSPFTQQNVSNFDLEYVSINIKIQVDPNYQITLVTKNVNLALKKYLSPWIMNCPSEIEIGKPLIDAKVKTFVQNIKGVLTVEKVTFSSYNIDPITGLQTVLKSEQENLMPNDSMTLLVSAPHHNIS